MTISDELLVETNGWKIKKLYRDGDFKNYVLKHRIGNGRTSIPFDEVHAYGGLLSLDYNGERSATFTEVIDGVNKYKGDDADMPREVFEKLKEIGPY